MTFPRIDSPCPLGPEEQRRIDGHCDRCDRHVHRLDGLDEPERRALLAALSGPACISYRVPTRRLGVSGMAIAATLVTATAFAAPPQAPDAAQSPVVAAPLVPGEEALDMIFVGGIQAADAAVWEDTPAPDRIEVMGGGIQDPAAATRVDAPDLPELPEEIEAASPSPGASR